MSRSPVEIFVSQEAYCLRFKTGHSLDLVVNVLYGS